MKNVIRGLILACFISYLPNSYAITNTAAAYGTAIFAASAGLVGLIAAYLGSRDNDQSKPKDNVTITASNPLFTQPGVQEEIILKNEHSRSVSVNSISFNGGAADGNVTIIENCSSVPANGECKVKLQATEDAYDGTADIIYDNSTNSVTANINVAKATLTLYEGSVEIPSDKDILVEKIDNPPGGHQTFKYTNSGYFSWLKPEIKWTGTEPLHVLLEANDCNTKTKLSPGESCTFKTTTSEDLAGDWGKLGISGTNLDPTLTNKDVLCVGSISILENDLASDKHLGYRSIKIVNTTKDSTTVTLTQFEDPKIENTDKIKYCPEGDTECYFKTDCKVGKVLDGSNPHCLVWFKSKNNESTDLYQDTSGTITLEATGKQNSTGEKEDHEIERFTVNTDQSLYACGNFTTPGNRIAKWDGATWSTLDSGLGGSCYTIFPRASNSDLYAGGEFTTPGKHIARWNGSNWSKVISDSDINQSVAAITDNGKKDASNIMFIGGIFTIPGYKIALCTNSDNCTAIPNNPIKATPGATQVLTLAYRDKDALSTLPWGLYIGGSFYVDHEDGSGFNFITQYDYETGTWHNVPSDPAQKLDATVHTLALSRKVQNSELYLGGVFNNPFFNMAKYNGAPGSVGTASKLGPVSPNGVIYASAVTGNDPNSIKCYLGGSFTKAGFGNHIAKYAIETNNVSPLGDGVDGNVYSIINSGDNDIYVGGNFTGHVKKWDEAESTWSDIDNSINNSVRGLAVTTSLIATWFCTPGSTEWKCPDDPK